MLLPLRAMVQKPLVPILLVTIVFLIGYRSKTPLEQNHQTEDSVPPNDRTPRRGLQSLFRNPLTSIAERIIPVYQPNQYPALQDPTAFVLYTVCTDINNEDCDRSNVIRFVDTENPPPNGFRYHSSGPPQLQGVFWTQQEFTPDELDFFGLVPRSLLASFAKTRHGGGVQTGELRTDSNGYEYVVRPVGDHTWSTNEKAPNVYLSGGDVLYLFDLVDGTLDDPLHFNIVPNIKLWFDCLRFSLGRAASPLFRFEQILITDPESPHRKRYPGSVVWLRRNLFFGISTEQQEYLNVQIVDGEGNTIEPAWSEFQREVPVTKFTGLVPDFLNDRQSC